MRRARFGRTRIVSRAPHAAAPFARRLVVLAKVPVAGRVKTRLARDIGAGRAAQVFRHMLAALLVRVGNTTEWQTIIAVAPDRELATRAFPGQFGRFGQGRGDIGRRMEHPMRCLPPGPVVVIGADIPGVRAGDIRAAFQLLGRHEIVFGPATDGGFWLVGARRRPRNRLRFGAVRWSTAHTLGDSLDGLQGTSIGFAAVRPDLDDGRDHQALGWEPGRRILPPAVLTHLEKQRGRLRETAPGIAIERFPYKTNVPGNRAMDS